MIAAAPERQSPLSSSILLPPGGKTKSDVWGTPKWLFEILDAEFRFTLDPATDGTNSKCSLFYTEAEDGLSKDWERHTVFLNPPYSKCSEWMKKAFDSSALGATVVCLIPVRSDTDWWHRYAMRGEVRFVEGRLQFGESKNNAPFPSAVIVFRPSGTQVVNAPTIDARRKGMQK